MKMTDTDWIITLIVLGLVLLHSGIALKYGVADALISLGVILSVFATLSLYVIAVAESGDTEAENKLDTYDYSDLK